MALSTSNVNRIARDFTVGVKSFVKSRDNHTSVGATTVSTILADSYHELVVNNGTDDAPDYAYANAYGGVWGDMVVMPPWQFSFVSQVFITVLYSFVVVLAVGGNIITLIVLVFGHRSKNDLTVFLGNLALADTMMAVFCIPFTFTETMLGHWLFGELMCPLVAFIQVTTVTVSVFTNVALGIDRLWAVEYALRPRLSRKGAGFTIVLLWVFSCLLACPQLVYSRSVVLHYSPGHRVCDETWPQRSRNAYTLVLLSVTYVIPLVTLTYTYSRVGTILWRRVIPGQAVVQRQVLQLESKRKVIKMLVAVVAAFGACWLPLHVMTCIHEFVPRLVNYLSEHTFLVLFFACHWAAMSNCLVNPFIYGFMNEGFRADLKNICRRSTSCWFTRKRKNSNASICQRKKNVHFRVLLTSSRKRWSIPSFLTTNKSTARSRNGPKDIPENRHFEALPSIDVYPPLEDVERG